MTDFVQKIAFATAALISAGNISTAEAQTAPTIPAPVASTPATPTTVTPVDVKLTYTDGAIKICALDLSAGSETSQGITRGFKYDAYNKGYSVSETGGGVAASVFVKQDGTVISATDKNEQFTVRPEDAQPFIANLNTQTFTCQGIVGALKEIAQRNNKPITITDVSFKPAPDRSPQIVRVQIEGPAPSPAS